MRYYVVNEADQLILFKVANDLIEAFEKEHGQKVIAHGNSIMEALLEFEKVNYYVPEIELNPQPSKYKGGERVI